MKLNFWMTIFAILFLTACSDSNRWEVDLSEVKVEAEFKHFHKDLYENKLSAMELNKKFPEIGIEDSIAAFYANDTLRNELYVQSKKVFGNYEQIEKELTEFFKHQKYYFPSAKSPKVFYSIGLSSDYQNPILISPEDNWFVLNLDFYLNPDFGAYKGLASDYIQQTFDKKYLTSDICESFANYIVPFQLSKNRLIDHMIYEGKLLMMQDALLPKTPDSIKIKYPKKKFEFCVENEGNIWNYFVEQQLLFKSDKDLIIRFLGEAPFTKFYLPIDQETPGRIGAWIGWQICRSYLKEHPEVTLEQFIKDEDYDKIFKESGYKPGKTNNSYENPREVHKVNESDYYEDTADDKSAE